MLIPGNLIVSEPSKRGNSQSCITIVKSINVITEASASGTGEATGVNAVHSGGHYAYDLYHTVHTGWGYVYIVELCGGADGNTCTGGFGR